MSWRSDVIAAVENRARRGRYMRINCPACFDRVGKPDHDQSISLNLLTGWWKCWRCNWRNRLDGFEDDSAGGDGWVDCEDQTPEPPRPSTYHPLVKDGTWVNHRLVNAGVNYVKSRGIPLEIAEQAELGYAWSGLDAQRVVMPVLGPFGWVGWTARILDSSHPVKYRSSKEFDRNRYLYGPRNLQDFIVLTEGPVDCLKVWPYGLATLGKPTLEQLSTLLDRAGGRPIVVALDGDSWREGMGIQSLLQSHGATAGLLVLPPKEDLGSGDRETLLQAAQAASAGLTVDFR
jgi:hypothetical protein